MEFLKIAKIISNIHKVQESYQEMKEDAEKAKWINTASIAVQNSKPESAFSAPSAAPQTRFRKRRQLKTPNGLP